MEVSGEVADLLVKEGLQVAELAARLSGKGIVNAAALLAAMVKNNYKVVGKVGVDRLNRENVESVIIPIKGTDLSRFEKTAKRFGVLYAAAKNENAEVVHIISNVNYSAQLNAVLEAMGYGDLPVCIAKTQYSFSDNAKLTGAPTGFTMEVREVRLAAGAGFVVVICGNIMTMPGLPKKPAAVNIDVDADGKITGLF